MVDELFPRSRGPEGGNFYDQVKRPGESLSPASTPVEPEQTKYDLAEKRMQAFEASLGANQDEINRRRQAGLITGLDAQNEREKTERNEMLALQALEHADRQREIQSDRVIPIAREHASVLAQQANDMGKVRARFDLTGQEVVSERESFEPGGNQFAHERARHQEALSQHRHLGDPLAMEERAAATEYDLFKREQDQYEKRILNEPNLTARVDLTTQKDIRAVEYVAYTAQRIAKQNEHLTGESENEVAETYRTRSVDYAKEGERLREEYRQHSVLSDKSRSAASAKEHGMVTEREARFEAFQNETQGAQPAQTRSIGRGGRD